MMVEVACSLPARMRGLLGRKEFPGILVLVPCDDVHTFGMKRAIDIAFVDPDGIVLRSYGNVGPSCRLRCKGAYATLERMTQDADWPEAGEKVDLKQLAKEAMETGAGRFS